MTAYLNALETYLGFLEMDGELPRCSAANLMTRDRLTRFVEALRRHLRPITVRNYLQLLTVFTRALYPNMTFVELEAINAAVRRQSPLSLRIRRPSVSVDKLLELAQHLLSVSTDPSPSRTDQHRFLDGLAIAMLVHAPARISDFATIRIDRELQRIGDRYRINLPSTGKTGRGQSFWLDRWLTPSIERYMRTIRPMLLALNGRWHRSGAGDLFWVNEHGGPLAPLHLSRRIGFRTETEFGIRIRAHQFRSIVATTIAVNDPGHVGIIKPILAHADMRTSEVHYNMASSASAAVSYHQILNGLRSEVES